MRALRPLQKLLGNALESVHKTRLAALWAVVEGLLEGDKLTLTQLGGNLPSKAYGKHRIKRVCRLLGNRNMHGDLVTAFRALACALLKRNPNPLILIDWTPVGNKRLNHALVASTPIGGRAVTLYAESHPEKRLGARKVEKQFLIRLKAVLSPNCKPIIVTDAGFRTPWFDAVEAMGWDYVGRMRQRTQVRREGREQWRAMQTLFSRARLEAVDLGKMLVTKSATRLRRLVIVKAKRGVKRTKAALRYPARKKRDYSEGDKSKPRPSERYRKASREPWLLATSLETYAARRIVDIYKTRMQIEETFRDLKSHRFGWSFDESGTKDPKRIEVLLLIASLAAVAILLAGIAAEKLKLHWKLQANTERGRRVLSLMTLGRRVLQSKDKALRRSMARDALEPLQTLVSLQLE